MRLLFVKYFWFVSNSEIETRILVGSVLLSFWLSVLWYFGLYVFILCYVYPVVLPESLNCPFLIAPLVFSNA